MRDINIYILYKYIMPERLWLKRWAWGDWNRTTSISQGAQPRGKRCDFSHLLIIINGGIDYFHMKRELIFFQISYPISKCFLFHVLVSIIKELFLNSRHVKPWIVYRLVHSVYGTRLLGNGIVTEVDHAKWSHKRAVMKPAFKRK